MEITIKTRLYLEQKVLVMHENELVAGHISAIKPKLLISDSEKAYEPDEPPYEYEEEFTDYTVDLGYGEKDFNSHAIFANSDEFLEHYQSILSKDE